jgi:hypothetical protein
MSPAAQRLFPLADGTGSRDCGLVKVSAELLQLTEKNAGSPGRYTMQGKRGWGRAKSRSIAVFVANRLPSGPDKASYELGYSLFSNLTGARSGSLSGARYDCFGEAVVKVCKRKHTKCSTIPTLQLQIRNPYGGKLRQSGLDAYPAVRMTLLPGRVWIHLTSRIPPLHKVVNRRGTSGRQPQREWAACGVAAITARRGCADGARAARTTWTR